jgi:hypothetical protein
VVNPPIPDNAARQAVNALAGYAYQLYQTLFAWIALRPGEALFVEVAEDYAVATSTTLEAAQVRATSGSITLRTPYVSEALNTYWAIKLKNPLQQVTYRYLTTSRIGKEQGLTFPDESPGLEYWRVAAKPGSDVEPIRAALKTLELTTDLRAFLESSSDEDLRTHLLVPVHWDCGEADLAQLKEMTALHTAWRAENVAQATAHEGKGLVEPLAAHVLSLATQKTTRRLTSVDLDEFIQDRLMIQVPRRAFRNPFGEVGPPQATTSLDIFIDPQGIPLPHPLLERPELVKELAAKASRGGLIFLQGSSGKGKSTAARLTARHIGGSWSLLDLRGLEAREASGRLTLAASRAATARTSLVLDDLPVEHDANIESALAVLAATLRSQDQIMLVTTSNRPSARMRSLLTITEDHVFQMPNLSMAEVSALVGEVGGDGQVWGAITHTVSGGHPQLVMARLRRLSREGWPEDELLGGFHPAKPAEEIDDERTATRKRLLHELDDRALALIDRLSVVGSRFDRRMALAISADPPPLSSPGDALTQLIGPWVEQLDRGYLRLSPLLSGSAKDNLTAEQVRRISIRIVNEIMGRNPIEGSLISVAFMHALASKHDAALARLASLPSVVDDDKQRYVAEQLFALEMLRTDQLIRPDNPHVSVLLREAQFKVCVERGSWDLAETVATRLFEEARLIRQDQLGDELTVMALSMILSEQKLPRTLPGWFGYVLEFERLLASITGPLAGELQNGAERFRRESGYGLSQFFVAFAATRRSSIAELEKVFDQLDGLEAAARTAHLSVLENGPGDLSLLVSNAWLGDDERKVLDGLSAAQRFEKLAHRADGWNATKLAILCEVARSVMLDEYALDPEAALKSLDDAEKRYGPRLELARQRAKVLYRKGAHKESLAVIGAIGDQLDPRDLVERSFAFRAAGISAAELRDWAKSIEYFGRSRDAALQAKGDLASMAVGLLGDIAVSEVRAGDVKSALTHTKQALEELQPFEPPKTDVQRYTRQLIGHVGTWLDKELFPAPGWDGYSALAPGKCSQPDPIPAVLERPLYPLEVCWYQLTSIERRMNLDVGIRAAIKAWPDSRKIVSLEGTLPTDDLAYFIRKRDLAGFQEALLDNVSGLMELARRSSELRTKDFNNAPRGTIPRLPLAAMEVADGPVVLSAAVMAYALSCVLATDGAAYEGLLALQGDVAEHSAFKGLVNVLSGAEKPGADPTLQLAGFIARLHSSNDDLLPTELFRIQCHLCSWLRSPMLAPALAEPFAEWVCRTWKKILDEQRFRLRQPAVTTPAIEAALVDPNARGLRRAAVVLLAADEAVGSLLSVEFREVLAGVARA